MADLNYQMVRKAYQLTHHKPFYNLYQDSVCHSECVSVCMCMSLCTSNNVFLQIIDALHRGQKIFSDYRSNSMLKASCAVSNYPNVLALLTTRAFNNVGIY